MGEKDYFSHLRRAQPLQHSFGRSALDILANVHIDVQWDLLAPSGQQRAALARRAAAFSPDGARIVTASDDKTARLWDGRAGKALAILEGHGDSVLAAAFSPDGARIVTASRDKTARLWDGRTGRVLATLEGHGEYVVDVAFRPDGSRIVTANWEETARLWDVHLEARSAEHPPPFFG